MQKTIIENPLLWFFIVKLGFSAYSQYQEKQADLLSAQKTGQINGGISFFEKYPSSQESSWTSWLNPLTLLSRMNTALFSLHPSINTRIDYLKALQK